MTAPPAVRALAESLCDSPVLRLDPRGHSAVSWSIEANGQPVARIKHHVDKPNRTAAEVAALRLATGRAPVPRVLALSDDGEAFAMTVAAGAPWSEADLTAANMAESARCVGRALAALHGVEPGSSSGVKRTSDPLPLAQRLLKNARRFARNAPEGSAVLEWLEEREDVVSRERVLIHGDLRRDNVIIAVESGDCSLVDLERASAAPAAWDFVKLRWWVLDSLPTVLADHALRGYTESRALPDRTEVEWFAMYEALGLAANFDGHYRAQATRQLHALLDGEGLVEWLGGSSNAETRLSPARDA